MFLIYFKRTKGSKDKLKRKRKIAVKSNPQLWEQSKQEALAKQDGKWSARVAQDATRIYKSKGGTYQGKKSKNNSLTIWTKQNWRYSSPNTAKASKETGIKRRYLPDKAWSKLSKGQVAATNKAKIQGSKQGKQWMKQPKNIVTTTRKYQ